VFGDYTGGVVTSDECGTELDHGITAVGYGVDENGMGYYICRNSWTADWGDAGHIKIGHNGQGAGICGIQQETVWVVTK